MMMGNGKHTERSLALPASTAKNVRHNMRLRKQARVTPWQDFWEFDCVGAALLRAARLLESHAVPFESSSGEASDSMSVDEALERYNVWKARSRIIPHAVESTAALAQIVWRDNMAGATSMELRLAYSSAILRSINGLADALQQQRAVAASVASLCNQLGIPAWLVDIRHESTHNHMPSLPVLRKASGALLQYFQTVYWEPLSKARHEHMDRGISLLRDYHEAARKFGENASQSRPPEDPSGMESESSSDSDTAADDLIRGLWGPRLGTTSNSFAALETVKQPTKKKKKAEPSPRSTERKKKRKSPLDPTNPSPLSCARAFIKSNLPMDVARHCALSFLIWKGAGSDGSGCGGAILTQPLPSANDPKEGFRKLTDLYSPLLMTLCREWPGFITTLLIHTTDAILSIEDCLGDGSVDANSKLQLFYLESWVRFFLSRSFLIQACPGIAANEKNRRSSEFVSSSSMHALQIPLNSLCSRCFCRSTGDPERFYTSGRLEALFTELLGSSNLVVYEMEPVKDKGSNKQITFEPQPTPENGNTMPLTVATGTFSLDELEKLLEGSNESFPGKYCNKKFKECTEVVAANEVGTEKIRTRGSWIRCESWDPCAIGSLPGFPN